MDLNENLLNMGCHAWACFMLVVVFMTTSMLCHDPTTTKPPHKDFDPVIEFPDADPNYKEKERGNKTNSIEEDAHRQLHFKVTNGIIHKNIEVHKKIEEMRRKIRNGDFLG